MRAFVFPGQGSQSVGMGKELAETFPVAKEVFQEVDEALGQKLSDLIFTGEGGDLNLTENTQPALMAVSVAVARVLGKEKPELFAEGGDTKFLAGHSLGEYSALTAGGAFTLSDAAKLLRIRGTAMQKAVPVGIGGMAAIIGLEIDDVTKVTNEASTPESQVSVANDNSFGQIVISGHLAAVERACELAKAKGAKRAMMLPVSAPFHCSLMKPAADAMANALSETNIEFLTIPLVANVTAEPVVEPEHIREFLVRQVTGQVRWRESVLFMQSEGVSTLVELGAGKVLNGLTKRIHKDMDSVSIGTPADIEAFLSTL